MGLFLIFGLTFACMAGPWMLPFDEFYIDLRARFVPPGAHILGTDHLGRDIAARLFQAGRIALLAGCSVMIHAHGPAPLRPCPRRRGR
ncbi:hypothetical protein [Paracoccus laeviglucosivorans]|uniref:hypothetical protein n=1 Tax=Paracoccus laeviglucosivorans TaxID=1197861 RepID=UPI001FE8034B|nr:hypothetical protein [Paracoccus laeviglucosivorans]